MVKYLAESEPNLVPTQREISWGTSMRTGASEKQGAPEPQAGHNRDGDNTLTKTGLHF